VQTSYGYDPYGVAQVTGTASDNPFQYTGRRERRQRPAALPQPILQSSLGALRLRRSDRARAEATSISIGTLPTILYKAAIRAETVRLASSWSPPALMPHAEPAGAACGRGSYHSPPSRSPSNALSGPVLGSVSCSTGDDGDKPKGGDDASNPDPGPATEGNKSPEKWDNQMRERGWTPQQIDDAIRNGQQYPAPNNINPKTGQRDT